MMTTYFKYYDENMTFKEISFKPRKAGKNSVNIPRIIKIGFKALGDFRRLKKDMKKEVITEFGLGLSFKLGIGMLDRYYSYKAVTYILAVEILILVLKHSELSCILVHDTGKSRLKTGDQCSAVHDIYTVTEGIDLLREPVIVLERYLDLYVAALTLYVDGILMDDRLFP